MSVGRGVRSSECVGVLSRCVTLMQDRRRYSCEQCITVININRFTPTPTRSCNKFHARRITVLVAPQSGKLSLPVLRVWANNGVSDESE